MTDKKRAIIDFISRVFLAVLVIFYAFQANQLREEKREYVHKYMELQQDYLKHLRKDSVNNEKLDSTYHAGLIKIKSIVVKQQ